MDDWPNYSISIYILLRGYRRWAAMPKQSIRKSIHSQMLFHCHWLKVCLVNKLKKNRYTINWLKFINIIVIMFFFIMYRIQYNLSGMHQPNGRLECTMMLYDVLLMWCNMKLWYSLSITVSNRFSTVRPLDTNSVVLSTKQADTIM